MRVLSLLLFTVFIHSSLSAQLVPPRQDAVVNSRGEACQFVTSTAFDQYFTDENQRLFIQTFENFNYMLNYEKTKTIIAEAITGWYHQEQNRFPIQFKTDYRHWINHQEFGDELTKGYAIPDQEGAIYIFIDFEYSENRQYILKVIFALQD